MSDWKLETDEHGDFKYTLYQFLLLNRHQRGGDWTDKCKDVSAEIGQHPDWDIDAKDTYMNWQRWYAEERNSVAA